MKDTGLPFAEKKLRVGDPFPPMVFETVAGEKIKVPDENRMVHLQFRRFADCPMCNTHIGQMVKRAGAIEAAGVQEVLFFHSSAKAIRSVQGNIPFSFIADPRKVYYRKFGVESSPAFILSPKALGAALNGMVHGHLGWRMVDGPLGLPADILVDSSGRIKAVKYGRHAYDQWSVEELLSLAKKA